MVADLNSPARTRPRKLSPLQSGWRELAPHRLQHSSRSTHRTRGEETRSQPLSAASASVFCPAPGPLIVFFRLGAWGQGTERERKYEVRSFYWSTLATPPVLAARGLALEGIHPGEDQSLARESDV